MDAIKCCYLRLCNHTSALSPTHWIHKTAVYFVSKQLPPTSAVRCRCTNLDVFGMSGTPAETEPGCDGLSSPVKIGFGQSSSLKNKVRSECWIGSGHLRMRALLIVGQVEENPNPQVLDFIVWLLFCLEFFAGYYPIMLIALSGKICQFLNSFWDYIHRRNTRIRLCGRLRAHFIPKLVKGVTIF